IATGRPGHARPAEHDEAGLAPKERWRHRHFFRGLLVRFGAHLGTLLHLALNLEILITLVGGLISRINAMTTQNFVPQMWWKIPVAGAPIDAARGAGASTLTNKSGLEVSYVASD